MTQLLQLILIIAGASILGVKFDMDIGWSVGLLCVALMNWPEKKTRKKKPCNHEYYSKSNVKSHDHTWYKCRECKQYFQILEK